MWLIQLSEREHNQYNKADTFVSSCIRAGGKVEQNSDTLYCKKNSWRGVVQLVEQRVLIPYVSGSIPLTPAK